MVASYSSLARSLVFGFLLIASLVGGSASAYAAEKPARDCKYVPETTRVEHYSTRSYNTTWGSALAEGATEGLGDALASEGRIADVIRRTVLGPTKRPDGAQLQQLPWSSTPFCRQYAATESDVSAIVAKLLPELGQPVIISDREAGVFLTDFGDYAHAAAAWKDRYLIYVSADDQGGVTVRVQRTVYISRTPGVFNRAKSAGRTETWILTQISDRLRAKH